jgi:large subunit ribosomal protein L18
MAKNNRTLARQRRHVRVRKQVFGTTERPRLNVFKSLSGIYAQVIDDMDGNTLVSASTVDKDLREKMKGVAERAKSKGISSVVFDRGGFRYVGRVKALADGAREGGLQF